MHGRPFRFRRRCQAWRASSAGIGPCRKGSVIIEFAILAPVFLLLLLGTFDIGQMVYARSVLHGAVEEAARSSSLETADTTAADDKVKAAITPVLPHASFSSSRLSYYDFSDIGRAGQWNDSDGDGICDNGESYVDENGNGSWDADVGESGNGGAGDVVLYTVRVTYTPVFAVPFLANHGQRTLEAVAVKKNQPFATQQQYGSDAGVCS